MLHGKVIAIYYEIFETHEQATLQVYTAENFGVNVGGTYKNQRIAKN